MNKRKLTIICGGGIRTPLVSHGLVQAQQVLNFEESALYAIDRERLTTAAALAAEAARQFGETDKITTPTALAEAVTLANLFVHGIRVGANAARPSDERK